MPREARLFISSAASAVRGYLKLRANIPSRWMKKCTGIAQAYLAGNCRGLPFSEISANHETTGNEWRFGMRSGNSVLIAAVRFPQPWLLLYPQLTAGRCGSSQFRAGYLTPEELESDTAILQSPEFVMPSPMMWTGWAKD